MDPVPEVSDVELLLVLVAILIGLWHWRQYALRSGVHPKQFRLRTLIFLLVLGPPLIAGAVVVIRGDLNRRARRAEAIKSGKFIPPTIILRRRP